MKPHKNTLLLLLPPNSQYNTIQNQFWVQHHPLECSTSVPQEERESFHVSWWPFPSLFQCSHHRTRIRAASRVVLLRRLCPFPEKLNLSPLGHLSPPYFIYPLGPRGTHTESSLALGHFSPWTQSLYYRET